ncbi:MAG: ABC transporter permease, partial [Ignavibacteria bacterium]
MQTEEKKYSQLRAMLAITKASLRSIVRNSSAVVFNLIFPLIFIIVFGFISGGGFKIDIAVDENSDRENAVYKG